MKRSKHQALSAKEAPSGGLQRLTSTACHFGAARSSRRNSTRSSALLLLVGLWTLDFGLWTALAAQTTESTPGRTDYRNFEIISKKNIFNPRRSPAYVPSERPQRARPRTETLALVGVMSYGKGPMAFFDGSRSDYRKVLKTNDSIAGFKLASIDSSSVKLASNTNEIEVQLGMQLAREEEGEWKLSARPESLESTYARATPLRSASQVNAERQSESDQNANPFASAVNSFLSNGGFRGNGFPFPGGGNFTPNQTAQDTQSQPVVTPLPGAQSQAAPANPSDILARLAARRQQETGEAPQQDQPAGTTSDQGPSTNPRGPSPQSPQNQPAQPTQGPNGQLPMQQPGQQQLLDQPNQQLVQPGQQPLDQSNQQPLDQSGQPLLDQFGQPIPVQPDQVPPNQ
jgi:hypothetical protein